MMRTKFLAALKTIIISAVVGWIVGILVLAYYHRRGNATDGVVYQQFDVENPDGGTVEMGTAGYPFYWSEIVENRRFQTELCQRLYRHTDGGIPPYFSAGTQFPRVVQPGKLTLLMWDVFLLSPDPEEARAITNFIAGRELFLEKLKERGVSARPIAEPILKRFWTGTLKSLMGDSLDFAVLPSVVVGLLGFYLGAICRNRKHSVAVEQV